MEISKKAIKKFFLHRKIIILLSILMLGTIMYVSFFQQAVLGSVAERNANIRLEETKQHYTLSPFESDGCSGTISNGWNTAVTKLSKLFPVFKERYDRTQRIPFESACVIHDQAYHQGIGGYAARLEADNALRNAILAYSIDNTQEIKERTGLSTDEEAIFLYEIVAQTIFNGVRVGGAPCTGMPYAWGFGYNNGTCE